MLTRSTSGNGAPVGLGFAALLSLIQRVEVPRGRAVEFAMLAAIRALLSRQPLQPADETRRDRLLGQLQMLDEAEIARIVNWIVANSRSLLPGIGRRQARRRLLMLLLLAKSAGVNAKFSILPVLNQLGLFGSPERLDFLLHGLSGWAFSPSAVGLTQDFLDLSAQALANSEELLVRDPESVPPREFALWSWQRRLVHLLAWRTAFDRRIPAHVDEPGINPAFLAGRFEFDLAYRRGFGAIGRRGGWVARATLRDLGYRDRQMRLDRGSKRLLVAACLLFVVAVGTFGAAWMRAHTFDLRGRELAQMCEERIAGRDAAAQPAASVADAKKPATAHKPRPKRSRS